MNTEQFAEMLNGRTVGNEITTEESKLAKENGLLVIYGASDDLVEFDGIFSDEAGAYGGATIRFTKDGKLIDADEDEISEALELLKENGYSVSPPPYNEIEAVWDEGHDRGEGDEPCSWQYKTDIPHSIFRIMEDEDLYCVGIVIDVKDLK